MNFKQILLLTGDGIVDIHGELLPGQPFAGRQTSGGCVRDGDMAVIVDHREIWGQYGRGWRQVAQCDHRVNTVLWTKQVHMLAGTEKGRLAWVRDGRLSFIESFDDAPTRREWFTPWGGPPDTHSLVQTLDGTLFAGIHVGWIMRSRDGGETWEQVRDGLFVDVHNLIAHPNEPHTLLVATARGFYISEDGGESFGLRSEPGYQRGVACFAEREVWLYSVSEGPRGGDAQIWRSEDRGRRWTRAEGLPVQDKNINAIHVTGGGEAIAIVGRDLYATCDLGRTWALRAGPFPTLFAEGLLHHIHPILLAPPSGQVS